MNDVGEPYDMLGYLRDTTQPLDPFIETAFDDEPETVEMGPEDLPPLPIGVFRDEPRPDYGALYQSRVAASAQKGKKK